MTYMARMGQAEVHAVRKDTASATSLSHGVLTVAMISLSQRGGATSLTESAGGLTPHLHSFFFLNPSLYSACMIQVKGVVAFRHYNYGGYGRELPVWGGRKYAKR